MQRGAEVAKSVWLIISTTVRAQVSEIKNAHVVKLLRPGPASPRLNMAMRGRGSGWRGARLCAARVRILAGVAA